MSIKLLIKGAEGKLYEPILKDEITWESERRGTPSKLTFTVVKDSLISFPEGAQVQLKIDGKGVFMGHVFRKNRNKDHHIEVTAYDLLRYLKSTGSYVYSNKTASDLIKRIAGDFHLALGTIEDTGYRIAQRRREDKPLIDTILDALDLTAYYQKKLYVLYDDFGKLTLKNIESMQLNLLVDADTAEDFDYETSIDDDTYNKIVLVHEDSKTKTRKIYKVQDNESIGNWGVLQYYETLQDGQSGVAKVENLLKLKNRKTRKLTVKGIFGDPTVRAGCSLPIQLNLGDDIANYRLVCERVVHHFTANHHSMDIDFTGHNGEYV